MVVCVLSGSEALFVQKYLCTHRSAATSVKSSFLIMIALGLALSLGFAGTAMADPTKPASSEDGKYADADGNPTYNITPDGKVDWYTFSGYRRYHSECTVCHGPDGAGSSYAPALVDSLKHMNYEQFTSIVVQGRKDVNTANQKVMPTFGTNRNVMCYLDDIFVYLRARSDGALARIRPENHDSKPQSAKDAETACMGN
jgi:methanol metabolism-related c-type cytochrome